VRWQVLQQQRCIHLHSVHSVCSAPARTACTLVYIVHSICPRPACAGPCLGALGCEGMHGSGQRWNAVEQGLAHLKLRGLELSID
jgi:hypothetical protein